MGIEAVTRNLADDEVLPQNTDKWRDWVSATATRNHALNDPLLDWLELYGEKQGFQRDEAYPDYDPRTDFSIFIMRKGTEFESAVAAYLGTRIPLCTIGAEPERSRSLEAAHETFGAMARGELAIYQAVLRDAQSCTYGTADLLIRSDVLQELFPSAITAEEAVTPASDLGNNNWHYRVVDFKFTTLHFLAGGGLSDSQGSTWAYMLQLYIYNRAIGRLQGYLPPASYLLGRGWEQTKNGITYRGTSCLDRLGAVPHDYVSRTKGAVGDAVEAACNWIRRVRLEGAHWQVLPEPSVPELRPHMGSTSNQPWHHAKQIIGRELQDLTLLWQVGIPGRTAANDAGIFRWTDAACTPAVVGVTGVKQAPILQAILDINRVQDGPSVRPEKVRAAEEVWRSPRPVEFYVDFETVSDLDDDFSRIPEKGGQPLIFMVGCGHVENGQWQWACFTADALTEDAEAKIIDDWLTHMAKVKKQLNPNGEPPLVFHWSHAEQSTFETAFNSACERHPEKSWIAPNWFDFLKRVIREEPVVARGAMAFGLKSIAKAMHELGLVDTLWEAGLTDGLGAMVGAWSCVREARDRGCRLVDTDLMQEIARYNEVDCRVMMEIVRYLRSHR